MPIVLIGIAVVALILYFSQGASAASTGCSTGCSAGGCCNLQDTYSYDELVAFAQQAGFGSDSNIAAAIALAESSGHRLAVGDKSLAPTNGPAIGLWQINSAKHTDYTPDELYDPATNAAEAFAIYSSAGNSFRPWTTYNSGAYMQYMG